MINLLQNKNAKERAEIKSREIAKLNFSGLFQNGDFDIEIISEIKAIKIKESHGIEFLAKAWKNEKPLGFGKDGSVEIERFRIFNPPILVDDLNGDVVREWYDNTEKKTKQRKLKEDPIEAIKRDLAHTISLVGKENSKIIKGKIGNTTSTFYPDAHPESTSVDGWIQHWNSGGTTWATLRDGAGTNANDTDPNAWGPGIDGHATTNLWETIRRSIYLFDTSAIPDADLIDSAILSIYGTGKYDGLSITPDTNVYSSAPASNTVLAAGDYDSLGSTAFSDVITYANWNTAAYNDFALNASGLTAISKTSISKFGTRNVSNDVANVAPAWASGVSYVQAYYADFTGTSSDPKLVVVHTAVSVDTGKFFLMF